MQMILTSIDSDKRKKHLRTFTSPEFIPDVNDTVILQSDDAVQMFIVVRRKFAYNYIQATLNSVYILVREATDEESE